MIIFIFLNSAQTSDISDSMSNVFVDLLRKLFPEFTGNMVFIVRKSAHFTEFTLLAVCAGLMFITKNPKTFISRIIYILFIGLITACTDEFIQLFSDGRNAQIRDVFIDFGGVCTGAAICSAVYFAVRKWGKGKERL